MLNAVLRTTRSCFALPSFTRHHDGNYTPENPQHTIPAQGDIIDMGSPAPQRAVVFSHELDRWLVSAENYWVVTTPEGARMAVDSGAVNLEGEMA